MRSNALVRLGAALAVAVAVALATASGALAASTLTVNQTTVNIAAANNIANDMTITLNGASLTVNDAADDITTAVAQCAGSGTKTVTCTFAAPITRLDADVGNMDDKLRADSNAFVLLIGGDGSDEVTATAPAGATENTNMYGDDTSRDPTGDGDDRIVGNDFGNFVVAGGGRDTLTGGAGSDDLLPGPGDGDSAVGGGGDDRIAWRVEDGTGDILDGGPGFDTLTATGITFTAPFAAALSIDLTPGTVQQTADGAASATATGFENAFGAGANITLRGTDGPNTLNTDNGNDSVTPGSGADLVDVAGGDDQVLVRDGFGDRVRCGAGADTIEADQFDELYDCETVARVSVLPAGVDRAGPKCTVRNLPARMKRKRFLGTLRPSVGCDEAAALEVRLAVRVRPRRGRLHSARAGDLVLAERSLGRAAGTRNMRLKVPRRLRAALGRRFSARLVVIARDRFGNRGSVTRTVRVR